MSDTSIDHSIAIRAGIAGGQTKPQLETNTHYPAVAVSDELSGVTLPRRSTSKILFANKFFFLNGGSEAVTARRSSGTLQVGAPGDASIMELVEGRVPFVDTRNNKRDGRTHLKPVQTVTAGVPFGPPFMRRSRCAEASRQFAFTDTCICCMRRASR